MEKIVAVIRARIGWILLGLFALLVLGKFHGGSGGIWLRFLQQSPSSHYKGPLLGVPRFVRADEWLFQTPTYLSSAEARPAFPLVNPTIRTGGQNTLVGLYAPAWHIGNLGKPMNWGFLLFDKEHGYSWYWYFKLFSCLIATYFLLLLLTQGNQNLSAFGSLWLTYSGYVQWWFSAPFVDNLINAEACVVFAYHFFTQNTFWRRLGCALSFVGFAVGFVSTLHPGVQVPFGYLALTLTAVLLATNRRAVRIDWLLLGGAVGALSLVLLACWHDVRDVMTQYVQKTVYPGAPDFTGGKGNLAYLQNYLFGWLLPVKRIGFSNACELSTIVNFFPALLLASPFMKKRSRLFWALLGFGAFGILWIALPFPSWLRHALFLNYVSEHRMYYTVALVGFYLTLVFIAESMREKIEIPRRVVGGICTIVALIYFFSLFRQEAGSYLAPLGMAVAIPVFVAMNYFLLIARWKPFFLFVAGFSLLPNLLVNPIDHTLQAYYGTNLSAEIRRLDASDPGQNWAALNEFFLAQILTAHGVHSLNAAHFYPDLELWHRLDPDHRDEWIYNRYAQVAMELTPTSRSSFTQIDMMQFVVKVTPADLEKLGAKYILSRGPLHSEDPHRQFHMVGGVGHENLFIYRILDAKKLPKAPKHSPH